jgi:iron complex transport system permease protein
MKSTENKIILLMVLLIVVFFANLSLGSVTIPVKEIVKVITGSQATHPIFHTIILDFRLPKAVTALLAGSALSASGLLMQTFFRNPLAGPFVLGISSGASLGVALVVLANIYLGFTALGLTGIEPYLKVIASALGAASVMLIVFMVSIRVKDSMTLLIIGLMFGSLTGSIISMLQYFSRAEKIQAYLIWTFGSLGAVSWPQISILLPIVFIGLGISVYLSKQLNALLLGEQYAQSMGVNLNIVRLLVIVATSLLAGGITAFCGPIAFIGIAVPHISRLILHTSNHYYLIPASVICGAILLLTCDIIAQIPGSQYALPINAITSMFGAPVVIWLVLRKKNLKTGITV